MCICTHTEVHSEPDCKTSLLLLLNSHCDKIQVLDKLHFERDKRPNMRLCLPISFPFFAT